MPSLDYPRTLRTWGKNMEAKLTPAVLGMKPLPTCQTSYEAQFNYDAMVRKWQYLFAYASAGFAQGYITWCVLLRPYCLPFTRLTNSSLPAVTCGRSSVG